MNIIGTAQLYLVAHPKVVHHLSHLRYMIAHLESRVEHLIVASSSRTMTKEVFQLHSPLAKTAYKNIAGHLHLPSKRILRTNQALFRWNQTRLNPGRNLLHPTHKSSIILYIGRKRPCTRKQNSPIHFHLTRRLMLIQKLEKMRIASLSMHLWLVWPVQRRRLRMR